ncbi:methylthioribulose-1-phosphate dehydratase [Lentzea albidocapillata]|uniref:Methylthioribose-1-phosphate isomerase n=1 Tax=Lentzea albidocapillata TaxID=40571 RepID=A0A1W2AI57_9PSEU|nr:methylthioribulose-1-phosphate dehydratase [Lentzea albidocapillata]
MTATARLSDRPSLVWRGDALIAVDQTLLPHEHRLITLSTVDAIVDAIRRLAIRGAPAIGVAGAFAVVISARRRSGPDAIRADAVRITAARPTAVNLTWAVQRVLTRLPEGPDAMLAEALTILHEDADITAAVADRTAEVVLELTTRRPLRILTHCNTGRFATTGVGTALGAIRSLADAGHVESVLATETRPLLQGARLTAYELAEAGIPCRVCVDSAAPAAIAAGVVDVVVVGADRVTANGSVANKIGTYSLALAAARSGVPFIVAAPESTLDAGTAITIEERDEEEVLNFVGGRITPPGAAAYNPAFDVTPADLVSAVVTELRVLAAGSAHRVAALARQLHARGWMDGTAGNLSVRLPGGQALITASGRSKGELTAADIVQMHAESGLPTRCPGPPLSAEASIHAALYRAFPDCGAVVHAHPPHTTAVAALAAEAGAVTFTDFEIIKGLGATSVVQVPVFTNWAEVPRIAAEISQRLTDRQGPPVLLIAHHGATAWGATLDEARNRLESLEALCQLHLLTDQR